LDPDSMILLIRVPEQNNVEKIHFLKEFFVIFIAERYKIVQLVVFFTSNFDVKNW
jgi:hypothetical protein